MTDNHDGKNSNPPESPDRLPAEAVQTGFHPAGFRIDKTASAMNRYTKWQIDTDNVWRNPCPVCFHSLPEDGWIAVEKFIWDENGNQ